VAVYKGHGSTDDEANFACRKPKHDDDDHDHGHDKGHNDHDD
jgi:hypothetical protein